jgi:hypothetical protein
MKAWVSENSSGKSGMNWLDKSVSLHHLSFFRIVNHCSSLLIIDTVFDESMLTVVNYLHGACT